jgi:hypothetical protein
MSQEFCVKGPFEIIRGCAPDAKYQKKFWEGVEKTVPYLVNAKGAYVFSLRNRSNYLPVYVGITGNNFKQEVLSNANCLKIAHDLKGKRGVLCVHLIAQPKNTHPGFSVNVSPERLRWIERFLIFLCRRKNDKLLNKSHTAFLNSVKIIGLSGKITKGNPRPKLKASATSLSGQPANILRPMECLS